MKTNCNISDLTLHNKTIDAYINMFKQDRKYWNNQLIYEGLLLSNKINDSELDKTIKINLLDGAHERFKQYIEPILVDIPGMSFLMGSNANCEYLYCGEEPQHRVMLSNYKISSIPITEELYSKFSMNSYDQKYAHLPITNVTWYDAFVFCKWCDCELPTEAEWEFASGKNVESEWCCTIDKLKDYAWYSENSNGVIRDVATLKSNCFGIYDMLGNIWEWVFDDYDENYYSNSSYLNPGL